MRYISTHRTRFSFTPALIALMLIALSIIPEQSVVFRLSRSLSPFTIPFFFLYKRASSSSSYFLSRSFPTLASNMHSSLYIYNKYIREL